MIAANFLHSQFKLSDLENSSFKGKPQWGKTGSHDPYHHKMVAKGYEVAVQSGAGEASAFQDKDYSEAGASVLPSAGELIAGCDVIAKINPFSDDEIGSLQQGKVLSFASCTTSTILIMCKNWPVKAFLSMDAIPRISRAQSMDVLSSQGDLALCAVILGAEHMTKIFPS